MVVGGGEAGIWFAQGGDMVDKPIIIITLHSVELRVDQYFYVIFNYTSYPPQPPGSKVMVNYGSKYRGITENIWKQRNTMSTNLCGGQAQQTASRRRLVLGLRGGEQEEVVGGQNVEVTVGNYKAGGRQ